MYQIFCAMFVSAHIWSRPEGIGSFKWVWVVWEIREMLPVFNIVGKTKDRSGHFEFNSLLQ